MGSVVSLLLLFALAFLLKQRLSEDRSEYWSLLLNRYVIYVALPALVLVYIPRIHWSATALVPVVSAWGLFALSSVLVLLVARLAHWSRGLTGALLFTVPYGNTSFLGVPFTMALYGEGAIPYTLIYDQMGSFLILSTFGIVTLAYYTGGEFRVSGILKRIFLFPAFVALLFSLMMVGTRWPHWIGLPLEWLAWSLAPVAMFSIGLQLTLRFAEGERLPFLFAMGVKLLLAPLLLLLLFLLLGLEDLPARVSILEAGMAPMVSSSVLAIMAGLERRFVASVLGYGIVLSFLTVPTLYWVIERAM